MSDCVFDPLGADQRQGERRRGSLGAQDQERQEAAGLQEAQHVRPEGEVSGTMGA